MAFIVDVGQEFPRGLEGVIACKSAISAIDGDEGRLIYRGIPIEVLAEKSTFEEASYLILFGELPKKDELENFKKDLKENAPLSDNELSFMKSDSIPKTAHPMDVLRTMVSLLGVADKSIGTDPIDVKTERLKKIIAKIPTIIGAFHRIREGKEPVAPSDELPHAANFLYMMRGEKPGEEEARIFDIALILHIDHGMNASTFSGMVTASSLSDMYSAITSAIGTLKGPLHGGANERVLAMLEEIGEPEKAEEYVKNALAQKKKIMGFGHRVYKAYDPRAKILKGFAKKLAYEKGFGKLFEIAEKVEEAMIKNLSHKGIFPNVDFYSGIVYSALGIPKDLFTPIFAMARVSGWAAHIIEYLRENRIFRPRAIYNGPIEKEYVPIEMR